MLHGVLRRRRLFTFHLPPSLPLTLPLSILPVSCPAPRTLDISSRSSASMAVSSRSLTSRCTGLSPVRLRAPYPEAAPAADTSPPPPTPVAPALPPPGGRVAGWETEMKGHRACTTVAAANSRTLDRYAAVPAYLRGHEPYFEKPGLRNQSTPSPGQPPPVAGRGENRIRTTARGAFGCRERVYLGQLLHAASMHQHKPP